jgi:hypothetical protein
LKYDNNHDEEKPLVGLARKKCTKRRVYANYTIKMKKGTNGTDQHKRIKPM